MNHSITSKLLSWFAAFLAVLLVGVGLLFLTVAILRSRLPYNSEGNYYDGIVNYHESSVFGYGVLAIVSFLAAVLLFGIKLLVHRARQNIQANR